MRPYHNLVKLMFVNACNEIQRMTIWLWFNFVTGVTKLVPPNLRCSLHPTRAPELKGDPVVLRQKADHFILGSIRQSGD
jgi:hypothetical protein